MNIGILIISILVITFNYVDASLDINNTQGIINDFNLYEKISYGPFFILILFLLYYFINKYLNKIETIVEEVKPRQISLLERKKQLINELNSLLKNNTKFSKSEFYEKLNNIFRKYFKYIGIKNSEILTLKELKKRKININFIKLFEKSYLNEFNDSSNSIENRVKLIKDFIKLIS